MRRLEPIDKETTPAEVHRVLRRAMLDGTFPPGSQLREAHLAADLGISRAPLREAFSRLEEEGLLVRIAFRGAFVAQVSKQTTTEIAELRYLVEPYSAERTANRLGAAMSEAVAQLVGVIREAADAGDLPGTIEAHLAFHRFFYENAGSEMLVEMWSAWETRLRLFLAADHRIYEDLDELASGHERLAKLVEAGDMDQFRAELAHHVHKALGEPLHEDVAAEPIAPG